MAKKKTTPRKPEKPNIQPRIKGNCTQDKVTGNWSRIPEPKS